MSQQLIVCPFNDSFNRKYRLSSRMRLRIAETQAKIIVDLLRHWNIRLEFQNIHSTIWIACKTHPTWKLYQKSILSVVWTIKIWRNLPWGAVTTTIGFWPPNPTSISCPEARRTSTISTRNHSVQRKVSNLITTVITLPLLCSGITLRSHFQLASHRCQLLHPRLI